MYRVSCRCFKRIPAFPIVPWYPQLFPSVSYSSSQCILLVPVYSFLQQFPVYPAVVPSVSCQSQCMHNCFLVYPTGPSVSYSSSQCILLVPVYPTSLSVSCQSQCILLVPVHPTSPSASYQSQCILLVPGYSASTSASVPVYPASASVFYQFQCILLVPVYSTSPSVSQSCSQFILQLFPSVSYQSQCILQQFKMYPTVVTGVSFLSNCTVSNISSQCILIVPVYPTVVPSVSCQSQ